MNIKFYESSSQRSPVTDFIDKQSKNDQAAIIAILTDIQDNGFNAKGCKFRQLKGKLWEIKIKLPSGKKEKEVVHVHVSIDAGKGNVSSYEAYVNPTSGSILKTKCV